MAKTATPMDRIKQLQAELKALKAEENAALEAEARESFAPFQEQMGQAILALQDTGEGFDPERAAHALRWIGENVTEYKRVARAYLKTVHNTVMPRKERAPGTE